MIEDCNPSILLQCIEATILRLTMLPNWYNDGHTGVILFPVAFRKTRKAKPFQIDAMVVLPEHQHTIRTLPPHDCDYPRRWKAQVHFYSRAGEKAAYLLVTAKTEAP